MSWDRIFRGVTGLAAVAVVALASGAAQATTTWILGNHPAPPPADQAEGPFGLRIDDASGRNTFDFVNGGAKMFFEITGPGTAVIRGTVMHNQSGQLWSVQSTLSAVRTTNEDNGGVEPWYDPSFADTLYDGILEDMILFGDSVYGDGGANLKQLAFEADRIGFQVNDLLMVYQGDPADADFDPDGDGDGVVELVGYPSADDMLAMVVAKGHNLDALTDQLAGLGWLTEEGQAPQYLRDFIFTFSEPVPEPSAALLFATGFLVCGRLLRRRA